ncbi:MAG: DUF2188 domain-containing protein [Actinomycetota bacterium]
MPERTRYLVSPDEDAWKVAEEGGRRFTRHALKRLAIRAAIDLAQTNPPSQVLIQGRDGRFQVEWTYGLDPYPPPG